MYRHGWCAGAELAVDGINMVNVLSVWLASRLCGFWIFMREPQVCCRQGKGRVRKWKIPRPPAVVSVRRMTAQITNQQGSISSILVCRLASNVAAGMAGQAGMAARKLIHYWSEPGN